MNYQTISRELMESNDIIVAAIGAGLFSRNRARRDGQVSVLRTQIRDYIAVSKSFEIAADAANARTKRAIEEMTDDRW